MRDFTTIKIQNIMSHMLKNDLTKLKAIAHLNDFASIHQQNQLVTKISKKKEGHFYLFELLVERKLYNKTNLSYLDGIIFKSLYRSPFKELKHKIKKYFQDGIVQLNSSNNTNYKPLFNSLISNNFQEANRLTQLHLHELAGLPKNNKRQWLYFTDILKLPIEDLHTIDTLWKTYSEGQFGFSIQRKIWLYNNKNWEKFWHQIGWKVNRSNLRYPNEFIWDQTAPIGHLPLFNQLRGVQVLASLFMHPVWNSERENQNYH